MAEKIKVGLSLNKKLFDKFREFLAVKHGIVAKGLISNEVELALTSHMAEHYTHNNGTENIHKPNPPPLVFQVKEEVKQYIKKKYGMEDIYQINAKFIREGIAMVRGTDKRTINGWLKKFETYGIMKWVGINVVEFL